MPDVPRMNAIEIEVERLRLAVRNMERQHEQDVAELEAFRQWVRATFDQRHAEMTTR